MKRSHRAYDPLKRVLDACFALVALVVLSPVLLVVAILVRLRLGTPVLFRQRRPGRDGALFTLYKFRTMTDATSSGSAADAVASDAERLTPLGRTLRASSLDELPELFNILLGQMSFVGPRPLLPEYLVRYTDTQARRHEVRPGLTGWAQVNGRNATSWEERFEMDVWYVDHRSFALDARTLLLTVGTVFGGSGVSAPGQATMAPFEGSPDRHDRKDAS